jgi:hypothetical protein
MYASIFIDASLAALLRLYFISFGEFASLLITKCVGISRVRVKKSTTMPALTFSGLFHKSESSSDL